MKDLIYLENIIKIYGGKREIRNEHEYDISIVELGKNGN